MRWVTERIPTPPLHGTVDDILKGLMRLAVQYGPNVRVEINRDGGNLYECTVTFRRPVTREERVARVIAWRKRKRDPAWMKQEVSHFLDALMTNTDITKRVYTRSQEHHER